MDQSAESLVRRCERLLEVLAGLHEDADVDEARALVLPLREHRQFRPMLRLAEAIARIRPDDARNRTLQAQALIETGLATVAVPLLEALVGSLSPGPADSPELRHRHEAQGLLGRAWKQIFIDAADRSAPPARQALQNAVHAYRAPYEADAQRNVWHGVNLLAVAHRARRLGVRIDGIETRTLAVQLLATLDATPADKRDAFYWASVAEAALGVPDRERVESALQQYVARDDLLPFYFASTLRQFAQLWELGQFADWRAGLLDLLRAKLLTLNNAVVEFRLDELGAAQGPPLAASSQLQAVLGKAGAKTYSWWRAGVDRARSVVAIRRKLGGRHGTGFVVRAGDLGLAPADELLVLTNFHVVNEHGVYPGLVPRDAEVVFEAVEGTPVCAVQALVWSSPAERLDASLLRLEPACTFAPPMPLATELPPWPAEPASRVYIVGHPGGRELSISFQDNELLGHEGPPHGKPGTEGVCRVHYCAPTEKGNSGSPVFDDARWEVIALHHSGGKFGMPQLNSEPGTYAANEGISIRSIAEAIKR